MGVLLASSSSPAEVATEAAELRMGTAPEETALESAPAFEGLVSQCPKLVPPKMQVKAPYLKSSSWIHIR